MEIGVFIPIGNNGWLISTTSPQYKPSFDLNRTVCQAAERYGFDFALSMIKLRGFGGPSRVLGLQPGKLHADGGPRRRHHAHQLFASVAVLTLPPALVARMAVTIDSISHGRFGVNIVSGWQKAEYDQMGLWPGEAHFERRYEYCEEYVTVIRDLWSKGVRTTRARYFTMDDCRLEPRPTAPIEIIAAGQRRAACASPPNTRDYNFLSGGGINTPQRWPPHAERLRAATAARAAYRRAGTDHDHRRRDRRARDGEVGTLRAPAPTWRRSPGAAARPGRT